jgi:hypothetical protein
VLFQIVAQHHDREVDEERERRGRAGACRLQRRAGQIQGPGDGSEAASHEQVFAVDEPGAERRRQPGAARLFDHPAGAQSASMICRENVWFATRRGGGLHLQRHTSSLSAIGFALNL